MKDVQSRRVFVETDDRIGFPRSYGLLCGVPTAGVKNLQRHPTRGGEFADDFDAGAFER